MHNNFSNHSFNSRNLNWLVPSGKHRLRSTSNTNNMFVVFSFKVPITVIQYYINIYIMYNLKLFLYFCFGRNKCFYWLFILINWNIQMCRFVVCCKLEEIKKMMKYMRLPTYIFLCIIILCYIMNSNYFYFDNRSWYFTL